MLVTDGLLEMRVDRDRTRYDEEHFHAFMAALAPATAAAAARTELIGSSDGLDDDTAVLALGVPPTTAPGGA